MAGKPLSEYDQWDKEDLLAFVNSDRCKETLNVEMKSGIPFQQPQLPPKFKNTLSEPISAFANTEGGYLFLGVEEDKENKSFFIRDGIPDGTWDQSKICDTLTSCTHPHYLDLRFHRVNLGDGRSVVIILIPEFHAAPIQASDCKYYQRVENGNRQMMEASVRALYYKGRSPNLEITFDAHLGKHRASDSLLHYYEFNLRATVSNSSHIRAHDVRIDFVLENILLGNLGQSRDTRKETKKFSYANDDGPLFGHDSRAFMIESVARIRAYYDLVALYRDEPDHHQLRKLAMKDDCLIRYVIFADDAPPKRGEKRINELLPKTAPIG